MTDLRAELEGWCLSYVTAFSAYDADAIAAHWSFPALIVSSGRSITFAFAERFNKNTSALLEFYRNQRVDRAVREVVGFLPMSSETVAVTVADQMLDQDGRIIAGWHAAYVLQQVNHNWRAVMALADGEVEAWAARGTPLGVKGRD